MFKKLLKMLEEARMSLTEAKDMNAAKLERISQELREEFERKINKMSKQRDLIKEAALNKFKLKKWKKGIMETFFPVEVRFLLSAPFIYGMIFPSIFMDIFLEIYQNVCFRLYKIPLVKRGDYIIIDRHMLSYLNWIEKINCVYCGYVNGLMNYGREIAARTERYWCPIKHAKNVINPHSEYAKFFEYLDAKSYREKRLLLRDYSDKLDQEYKEYIKDKRDARILSQEK